MGALVHDAPPAGLATLALHPEATADPSTLRWVVAGPSLDALDAAALRRVLGDPVAEVVVEPHAVLVTLAAGRAWRDDAAAVRTAIRDAVTAGRTAPGVGPDADAALARAAERVLTEDVAGYAAGHGGTITLVGVHDGVVEVELGGTCGGCPAAVTTLQGRLARRLRDEVPWLVEVRARAR